MIQLKQITLNRSQKVLLKQADVTIFAGQKVGLIGKNGSGKTSLFLMLQGELMPDEGEFSIPKQLKMAHIQQELPRTDLCALDYAQFGDSLFAEITQAIEQAEQVNDGMRLAELHMRMAEIDGYSVPSKAAKILRGLGFTHEELTKSIQAFSGGWQMRLNLARLLMERADILLLDEPTNHLDLEAIVWLEDWLQTSKQTIVLISHDRDFMDHVVTHIVHLQNQQLQLYTGNYSQFETQRAQALILAQAAYKKQAAKREHLQSFVDRFRYKASKARQAQSRIKMLERMEETLPIQLENPFRFQFRETKLAGNPMLTLEHVAVGYGEKVVLQEMNFSIRDGDRIGLLGKNGAGKSTLIKLLQQELMPLQGKMHVSPKLKIGYFAQHQLDLLNPQASPFEHLLELDQRIEHGRARQYLGSFHFSNDDVFRPVGSFSGGEKSRLVLALLIWQQPNLLLLDEPTNHLDLDMREALNLALQDYTGAVILVSHDRHLLNCTSNEFWLVANGRLIPFAGDLEEYQRGVLTETVPVASSVTKQMEVKEVKPKKTTAKIEMLEQKLRDYENSLAELDVRLSDSVMYTSGQEVMLAKTMQEREAVARKIKEIEEQLLRLYEGSA